MSEYGWGQLSGYSRSVVRLANAFSLNMLEGNETVNVQVEPESLERMKWLCADADIDSCVGHTDTAAVLSTVLGSPVACNRTTVSLKEGDVIYVAQYSGPRLPEGATTLPEGAAFKFYRVEIYPVHQMPGWAE